MFLFCCPKKVKIYVARKQGRGKAAPNSPVGGGGGGSQNMGPTFYFTTTTLKVGIVDKC